MVRWALAAVLVVACGVPPITGPAGTSPPPTGERPTPGGTLTFVVNAEPAGTLDAHRETGYALLQAASPHYSTLYRFDPTDLSRIVPDVAAAPPTVSADGRTWTIRLRTDVRFHDGTPLSAADVLATYSKIVFPPQGVPSARQSTFAAVDLMETPSPDTIVFRLRTPSASFLANLASPWNWIYSAAKLKQDPHWYEKNVMGTGPFTFVEHVNGKSWEGRRNPDYFVKDRPYLDGYLALFSPDPTGGVSAIKTRRAQIEFRGYSPEQRDDLSRTLPNDLAIQETAWLCVNDVVPNVRRRPFYDARARRALSLAIDRWRMGDALSKVTLIRDVGGIMRPGGPFAMPEAELVKIAGFSKDGAASKERARRLLVEAGAAGYTFDFLSRAGGPDEQIAVALVAEWKAVGLNPVRKVKADAGYEADLRTGSFDVALDTSCDTFDEPDQQLARFRSASKLGAGLNVGNYDDPKLDELIAAQGRETDPARRRQLVAEIERYALDEMTWQLPLPWWLRIVPYNNRVRGWRIGASPYLNQDLVGVWLAR